MIKSLRYAVFVLMLTPAAGVSQDFDAGDAAYDAGDYATALREWRPLAEQGNAVAQDAVGILYHYGHGVTQDFSEALRWFRLAAEQGFAQAQHKLGHSYYHGQGVRQDYAEAAHWYRLAAEQGYALGQYSYGLMYYLGQGVMQDYAEAAHWYRMAAEQGYAAAQYSLGSSYYHGQGVTQDYAEAAHWYRMAAEQGYAAAQHNLGYMYLEGEGVPKDEITALMWFDIAVLMLRENERTLGALDALERRALEKRVLEMRSTTAARMTSDARAEAQQRKLSCLFDSECEFPASQLPSERGNDEPISLSKGPSAEQIAGAEARDLAYRMRIAGQFFGLSETEIDVGEVDLERCVTTRDDLAYCRYSIDARMSENALGPIARMMNMGFVLTGYQWSSFVVREGRWELDLKYDHCSVSSSRIRCTRRE